MDKSPEAFRTISEVADVLDVPPHVLRFWESRFSQVRPVKRGGGRRYYRPEDVRLLRGIRGLLYDDGMTIKGVQKILRERGVRHVIGLGTLPDGEPEPAAAAPKPEPSKRKPAPAARPAPAAPQPDLFTPPPASAPAAGAPAPVAEAPAPAPVAETAVPTAVTEAAVEAPAIDAPDRLARMRKLVSELEALRRVMVSD
ncbi:MerR family transcriptional regulator [Amaricoccus sp.]|uniref:MerR family transcriptional regulator n=1 Tax=Amaricoccus sp. TaxID=1872485 RepID=UPI001B5F39B2|nr:MerR family transcriptional regulator [Amaricoccus sp.]MBP7000815.1 MerR family transcriptional regulator [Amaricoccus sp.]